MAKTRYRRLLVALVLLAGVGHEQAVRPASRTQISASPQQTYELINGQWFDGTSFNLTTFYSVDGLLTQKKPSTIDQTIDLAGGYVVPPFGDAHTHHFDSPANVSQQIDMYLHDGVFYAKVMTDIRSGALQVASRLNNPTSVDVSYAHGGLTGSHSHPIPGYEARALGILGTVQERANADTIRASRLRENDAYYIIDTAADIENKWPLILEGQPDFIKVYLLDSEGYKERKQHTGEGGGIDPKLLPEIIARAHKAGLRVSAHVDSAADYHAALVAGVDEMAHIPGYFISDADDVKKFAISAEDGQLTAKGGVFVIPTASAYAGMAPAEKTQRVREMQLRNLRLLKNAGVKFGVGPDIYGKTPLIEATYLHQLGVFSNLELLKMWCENTPEDIFPKRKIGRLQEGYEASFIVLPTNPVENFDAVNAIKLRFKQGHLL